MQLRSIFYTLRIYIGFELSTGLPWFSCQAQLAPSSSLAPSPTPSVGRVRAQTGTEIYRGTEIHKEEEPPEKCSK